MAFGLVPLTQNDEGAADNAGQDPGVCTSTLKIQGSTVRNYDKD